MPIKIGNYFTITKENTLSIGFTGDIIVEAFRYASENGADICIDNIRFAPDTSDGRIQFDPDMSTADTFIEKLSAIFIKAIGMIISVFR